MNTYKINYKSIRQEPAIAELLSALERGFTTFGLDFYLVGALARDVWMLGIKEIKPRRTTSDIDFAVFINDKGMYETLKDFLIEHEGFIPARENAFALIWKDKTVVDLMPFGAIEDEERRVTVEGTGFTTLDVPGFKEVYEDELAEIKLGINQFKVCSLPGIVILKLLAWDDRPEKRLDDIKDISEILEHYFDMRQEEIWDSHNDIFEGEETNLLHVGARVMGREMKIIASRNTQLYTRISGILNTNTGELNKSRIGKIMVQVFDNTVEDNVNLLNQLKKGYTE